MMTMVVMITAPNDCSISKKRGWKWRLAAEAVMARGCEEQKD